jgi:hypothetical protein
VKASGWAAAAAKLCNIYCIEIIIKVDYVAQPSFSVDITGLF